MADKPKVSRDDVLRRMLKTPPKRHGDEMKTGRRRQAPEKPAESDPNKNEKQDRKQH